MIIRRHLAHERFRAKPKGGFDRLSAVVTKLLGKRWSPQQISRHLRHRFPDEPSMRLWHESIYQAG